MRELIVHITGMSCGHCLNAVSKALHSKPGVQVDSVQIGSATAVPSERDEAQERV